MNQHESTWLHSTYIHTYIHSMYIWSPPELSPSCQIHGPWRPAHGSMHLMSGRCSSSKHRRPSPACDIVPPHQWSCPVTAPYDVRELPANMIDPGIYFSSTSNSLLPLPSRPLRNLGFGKTGGRLRTSVRVREEVPKDTKRFVSLAKFSRILSALLHLLAG